MTSNNNSYINYKPSHYNTFESSNLIEDNFTLDYVKPQELDELINEDNLLNVLQPEGLNEINNIVDSIKNDELNMYSNKNYIEIPYFSNTTNVNDYNNFHIQNEYLQNNQFSEGQTYQSMKNTDNLINKYDYSFDMPYQNTSFYINKNSQFIPKNTFECMSNNMKVAPLQENKFDFYPERKFNYHNGDVSPSQVNNNLSPISFTSFSSESFDQQNIEYNSVNSSPISNESLFHSTFTTPPLSKNIYTTTNSFENLETVKNGFNNQITNDFKNINYTDNTKSQSFNNDIISEDDFDEKIEELIREAPKKSTTFKNQKNNKRKKRNDLYTEDYNDFTEDITMSNDYEERVNNFNVDEITFDRTMSLKDRKENEKDYDNVIKKPKTERRKAHNLIEKKYRCSINVQINQLKEIVAKKDEKLSKSATLKKAVDKLNSLMDENEQLYYQIDKLKQGLKSVYEVNLKLRSNQNEKNSSLKSPSNSDYFSGSDTASPPIKNIQYRKNFNVRNQQYSGSTFIDKLGIPIPDVSLKKTKSQMKKVMDNKSRVTLCIFMFCMLIFNPISIFSFKTYSNQSSNIRTSYFQNSNNLTTKNILSFSHRILNEINNQTAIKSAHVAAMVNETANKARHWYQNTIMENTYIWGMNAIIIISILYKLLVSGEPVTDYNSPSWETFIKLKKSASTAISKDMLGRPIPKRGFDELLTVFWQIIRHLLNSVWVGRYFSRRKRSPTQLSDAVCKSHAATALVYHQLHQLHLIMEDSNSSNNLRGLNLVLNAVNLSESAGISNDKLTHAQRADIYINASIRVRLSFPSYIGNLIGKYFMRRAKRHVRKAAFKNEKFLALNWVFTSHGKKFLSDIANVHEMIKNIKVNSNIKTYFCRKYTNEEMKPLNHLTILFKADLIEQLIDKYQTNKKTSSCSNSFNVSETIQLLLSIGSCPYDYNNINTNLVDCTDASLLDWNIVLDNYEFSDEITSWWTHLLSAALYWNMGLKMKAQTHYAVVIKVPKEIKECGFTFATILAFCTKKMAIDDSFNSKYSTTTIYYCMKGIDYINDEIKKGIIHTFTDDVFQRIFHKTKFLTIEWYLSCLLEVWYSKLNLNFSFWQQPQKNNTLINVYKTLLKMYTYFIKNYSIDNSLTMKNEFYNFCYNIMITNTQESIASNYSIFMDKFRLFYNQQSITHLPSLLHFLKYFVTQEKVHLASFLQYHTNVHFKIIKKLKDELKYISFNSDESFYEKKNF
ncbi:Helix loop helix protein 106 [Strongyloides ratti]|uniref:Helix loop helix protein 106 n=1 Tax=Strongyloides ratti TaxID=34506 RepID=A0A090LDP1_STRRB|nr:Helix loop helix protein 106 [Strongyloides ratti]CEF67882.1 Helix loop helix protein 106 [Strongyloides ratti]